MSVLEADQALGIEKVHEAESSSIDNSIADPEKNPQSKEDKDDGGQDEEPAEYLSGPRLGLIVLGLCLAVLLVGLVSRSQRST
jgi:hypothetical protein